MLIGVLGMESGNPGSDVDGHALFLPCTGDFGRAG